MKGQFPSLGVDTAPGGVRGWSEIEHEVGFGSIAVHAGERLVPVGSHPITTPIHTAVGFEAGSAAELDQIFEGARPGYVYTRHGNPTLTALEETLARLERGAGAVAFGSGMAALHAAVIAADVRAGDRIVSARDIYGATHTLFRDLFYPFGIETHYADTTRPAALARVVREIRPRVIFVEAISNPLLRVADLDAISAIAREAPATLIVDATFATPRIVRPLEHGADIVVHSATKYLNGHGDATGGAVIGRTPDTVARVRQISKLIGGLLGPFEAYLTLRGTKTLGLRIQRQSASAEIMARRLEAHPRIGQVIYPGLVLHPDHEVAARLFEPGLFGAVVSFTIRDADREGVFRFMDALRLCCAAPTVGDIYSQLLYPWIASHRDLTPKQREAVGITENLVRLSIGIEEVEDIVADLEHALEAV